MLKDMMENADINGNVFTRARLRSNAENFKPDRRTRAKDFTFQHHHVVDMIDGSYLVCVTDPVADSVMLLGMGPNVDPYTISDCHPMQFVAMRLEGEQQLEMHINAQAELSARRKGRKVVKNA